MRQFLTTSRNAVASLLCLCSQSSSAQEWSIVFDCGSSSGYRVDAKDGSFSKDGMSSGRFQLVRRGNDYDLRIVDGVQRMFSAREDGASVVGRETGDGSLQVIAYYPLPNVESYLFSRSQDGKARFVSASTKDLGFARGGTLFTGECTHR